MYDNNLGSIVALILFTFNKFIYTTLNQLQYDGIFKSRNGIVLYIDVHY